MLYDYLICGSGLAGASCARLLAEKNYNILVLEKLNHIGGSVYDYKNSDGVLVHKYGPHIFHTKNKEVFDFISRFTEFTNYSHKVLAKTDIGFIPVPFNLTSLKKVYGEEKTLYLTNLLINTYGSDTVSVMELRESHNPDLRELGEYVYKNIFLYYTMKQWGKSPSEIDPSTTGRVPVRLSDDDRYFTDAFQGMPTGSYTETVKNMLSHKNITVELSSPSIEISGNKILFNGNEVDCEVIYTGEIDRLFSYIYGALPYRTINFVFETLKTDSFQPCATINYTVSEDFTRITEFKKLTGQILPDVTTIMKEFPCDYTGKNGEIPYYPVACKESDELYKKYMLKCSEFKNLHLVGRLAQYRYLNMDLVIAEAMSLCKNIKPKY